MDMLFLNNRPLVQNNLQLIRRGFLANLSIIYALYRQYYSK